MPPLGPTSRRDIVASFRRLGFEGPYVGGKHEFMVRERATLRLPNPHRGDIGVNLLARLLEEAGVSREEWEAV